MTDLSLFLNARKILKDGKLHLSANIIVFDALSF